MSSYDPDGQFSWSALSKLQAVGIEVITALQKIQDQNSPIKDRECTRNDGKDGPCPDCQRYKDFLRDDCWLSAVEKWEFFQWLSSKIVPPNMAISLQCAGKTGLRDGAQ